MTGPVVAVTCGEPAGIGPEIAAKAWDATWQEGPIVWLGDPAHLPSGTQFAEIEKASDIRGCDPGVLPVLRIAFEGGAVVPGQPMPAHASGVIAALELGVDLCMAGQVDALCTAPISKAALIEGAGFAYPGHTEFLAARSGSPKAVMMLASSQLRVVPLTIHCPLSEVPKAIDRQIILDTLAVMDAALRRDFGIQTPIIAVAGLNPHAGEDGLLGREETDIIGPALEEARKRGLRVRGPLSADTMFSPLARSRYDAALCMYHDQALIPIKTIDFDRGVNVTLGLPFVRTSPDHGTAFDIAGRHVANPTSMIEAIRLARRLTASHAAA